MNHPRVIIDTDTGVDDALALILALRSPELSVEAITTVAGNVGVRKCTRNVLRVLDVIRPPRRPQVAEGAVRPLRRPLVTAPEVHGRDGLGDIPGATSVAQLAEATRRKAWDVILDLCERLGPRLTIVAIGPLTNIARALRKDARLLRKAGRIVSMGGAFRVPGNTGPVAEFNYFVDPEAAAEVLESGLRVRIVPLDVTETVAVERKEVLRWARNGGPTARFVARCTRNYMAYHRATVGFHGGYLHDPAAVIAAMHPEWFDWQRTDVRIETSGRLTRGMSVADFRQKPSRTGAVSVAMRVRRESVLRLFRNRVLAV